MFLLITSAVVAQRPVMEEAEEFEVASVKPLGAVPANLPLGKDLASVSPSAMGLPIMKGGPGTATPGRFTTSTSPLWI
ncbi:MAG: hypothetical protein WDO73_05180 [Ignavibacteriota bacterium]